MSPLRGFEILCVIIFYNRITPSGLILLKIKLWVKLNDHVGNVFRLK